MTIPISFPQPLWIFMRKFPWMSKQSKSSTTTHSCHFILLCICKTVKYKNLVPEKCLTFLTLTLTGMCCGTVLGVPETPLYTGVEWRCWSSDCCLSEVWSSLPIPDQDWARCRKMYGRRLCCQCFVLCRSLERPPSALLSQYCSPDQT